MSADNLWGWDAAAGVWRKILVDASGNLTISPITFPTEYPLPAAQLAGLEAPSIANFPATYPLPAAQVSDLKAISSYPDPIISQATPEDLKHVPHGYYAAGPAYLPLAVDVNGVLQTSGGGGATQLSALTDVDLAGLTDGDFIYWDSGTAKWKRIAHKDATTGVHGVGAGTVAKVGDIPAFAAPTILLAAAAAAGAAGTVIRSDGTIAAFDATNPSTQAFADAPVVGVAAFAARRDHKHGMMSGLRISSSNYAGNNGANRAIAHGLGTTPVIVFIVEVETGQRFQIITGSNFIYYLSATADGAHAVTAPNGTNFYVGNAAEFLQSGNSSSYTYVWVAIG